MSVPQKLPVMVFGASARALGFLASSERYLAVEPGSAAAAIPALLLAVPCLANISGIARLRYDMAYRDVPFIALADPACARPPGTPVIDFDDWLDIEAATRDVFLARLDGAVNAAASRAALNKSTRVLHQLDGVLRVASQPADMTLKAATLLGQTLGVNRCAYADVENDQDTFNLTGNYNDGVDTIVGRYTFGQFGAECLRLMRAGEPYVVEDSERDERTAEVIASYRATAIRAVVCVPVMKDRRFVAAMAVHQNVPRVWQMDEVRLLLAFAERCWESIERTKIERELKAKDARYRALVETMSAVVWNTDGDGTVSTENLSWEAFTGQTFEQYAGMGWLDAVHPEDRPQLWQGWAEAVAGLNAYAGSYRLRRRDREYRYMIVRGVPVPTGTGTHSWMGNCLDVSEARLAEQKLAEASTRLLFTLQSAEIADWDLDLDHQTCARSERHDRLFGYPRQLPNWNIETLFEHVHPDDVGRVRDDFERSVRHRGEWHFECRVIWPDSTVHWLSGNGFHYRQPGSDINRMLGIVYDITGRKQSELALIEADKRKDEFLAMLAHELRNPLAPIAAAAELLRMYLGEPAKLAQASAVISRQVKHMTGLIEDLLDVSRVTRGLVRIEKRPCDLARVIDMAVEQTRSNMLGLKHDLSVVMPANIPMLMGDEARLVQVVANLLNNAAKYTPPGGNIILRVDFDDRHVACSVSDNGMGMSHDFIRRAFDLFTQADAGIARSSGGLGLGLALVRSLVEMHGGTVSAHSEGIGLGSQFAITLPRTQGNEAVSSPNVGPAATRALSIVIVDDNVDAAESLGKLLGALGHAVTVMHHPRQALAYVPERPVDVFLVDIGLPDIDGKALAKRLKTGAHPRSAIIAVSGYDQSIYTGDERTYVAEHLVKPVNLERLLGVFSRIFG